MENWEKQFVASNAPFDIDADDYSYREMVAFARRYSEAKATHERVASVVGRSEQLSCEHRWKEYEGPSCRMGWKCSKCKEVKYFAT